MEFKLHSEIDAYDKPIFSVIFDSFWIKKRGFAYTDFDSSKRSFILLSMAQSGASFHKAFHFQIFLNFRHLEMGSDLLR